LGRPPALRAAAPAPRARRRALQLARERANVGTAARLRGEVETAEGRHDVGDEDLRAPVTAGTAEPVTAVHGEAGVGARIGDDAARAVRAASVARRTARVLTRHRESGETAELGIHRVARVPGGT